MQKARIMCFSPNTRLLCNWFLSADPSPSHLNRARTTNLMFRFGVLTDYQKFKRFQSPPKKEAIEDGAQTIEDIGAKKS